MRFCFFFHRGLRWYMGRIRRRPRGWFCCPVGALTTHLFIMQIIFLSCSYKTSGIKWRRFSSPFYLQLPTCKETYAGVLMLIFESKNKRRSKSFYIGLCNLQVRFEFAVKTWPIKTNWPPSLYCKYRCLANGLIICLFIYYNHSKYKKILLIYSSAMSHLPASSPLSDNSYLPGRLTCLLWDMY